MQSTEQLIYACKATIIHVDKDYFKVQFGNSDSNDKFYVNIPIKYFNESKRDLIKYGQSIIYKIISVENGEHYQTIEKNPDIETTPLKEEAYRLLDKL